MATLFKQWQTLIGNQTKETFNEFWEEYSGAETKIYSDILDHPQEKMTGTIGELAEKYDVRPVIFMGFLDGINESITKPNDLEDMDEASEVEVEIIPEKLFFNMLKADADYLYSLEQWEDILGEEKMVQIAKEYKQSRTVRRATPKIGRNDPCPCGSGKKYKHCCGR
ncbi:MAG: SEC-C domain-containing protein [Clostridia bacterium]|jgi:preprotein translocase subunit SecA|nr:SEC-C domain-containing protein [Bacillota bacterium]MCR5034709.1 SEC-C domain-containing protein [Clostridia bacterium]